VSDGRNAATGDAVRVAVIGYGLGGSVFHAPLVAATPGMRLEAIVTSHPDRRRDAARAYPSARLLENADALWADAQSFDLVVITTPNATHVPLAAAALEAGLHVVIDKPFARTPGEARALDDEARRRGLTVTPFQNRRWDGDFLTVQRLIDDEALGVPFRFESRFERWRASPKPRWVEANTRERAEGMLYDLGTHLIDQALVLFGPVVDVYAELDARHPEVHAEDDAFVALTHANGVRTRLWMSAVAGQSGPRFALFGGRGTYMKHGLDPQEDALKRGVRPGDAEWGTEPEDRWGTLAAGDAPRVVRTERGAYERYYAGIVAMLRGGAPPPVDTERVIDGLEIIAAAYQSAAERKVVRLG
jgi:scyllo-inositol 2-dehydrogenase (NADP+)